MGLDIVEFVMEVEEAFALRIPDSVAEKILTPRMLIDYVYSQTIDPRKVGCLSQRAFYAVRRQLCERLDLPRSALRPTTDLLAVLPQLNARIRFFARSWVRQAFWLHRTKSQSVDTASADLFDRKTRLEPTRFLKTF